MMECQSEKTSPIRKSPGNPSKSGSSVMLKRRRHLKRISSAPNLKPSYVLPKKDQIRSRKLNKDVAYSPAINHKVKEYLSRADEKIEDYLERIVQNVQDSAGKAEFMVQSCVEKLRGWKACHFEKLPIWMKDNDFLHFGHRPELPSFAACFQSIFRIHTETGNIWTHLIGFVAFVIATIVFYVKPLCDNCHQDIQVNDKLIFLCFFIGAILCLACSTLFHTVACHSKYISAIFSRLDYAGIALLIVGSTIPWLYYGFYCQFYAKLTYITAVSICGLLTILLLTVERFNAPDYRTARTLVFVTLAFVSALPIIHFLLMNGISDSIKRGSLDNLLIMGTLYLLGAFLYAARIPERWMPGKCDIWFQSHQLFHLLVVAAAFVHYHGISEMALHRLNHLGPLCPTLSVGATAAAASATS